MLKYIKNTIRLNSLPNELFQREVSISSVKKLFKAFVNVVELENHSYCNRKCSFCPNSYLDRFSNNKRMSDAVFENIISGLQEIKYNKTLLWSYFHEPFADESIFPRLIFARKALPNAKLKIISNGDKLTQDMLKYLESIKLDCLRISYYPGRDELDDNRRLNEKVSEFVSLLGLKMVPIATDEYALKGSRIYISLLIQNFYRKKPYSRAGAIKEKEKYLRKAICERPLHHVVIDHSGNGMLCCETRSDYPPHKKAIIGNLAISGYGIFELYRDMAPWRRSVLTKKFEDEICSICQVEDNKIASKRFPIFDRITALLPLYMSFYLSIFRIYKLGK